LSCHGWFSISVGLIAKGKFKGKGKGKFKGKGKGKVKASKI